MNTQIDNLGKVSLTVEKDYWSSDKCYDKLVIVEKENEATYLSRKPVPAGTSIYNREYWIKLGASSSNEKLHVYIGVGQSYENVTFIDTNKTLSNNLIITLTPTNECVFIKVGKDESVRSLHTFFGYNSSFNYNIALEEPVLVDNTYKYYKSASSFNSQDAVQFIINQQE